MRIIGGKHRGRILLRVGKKTTRETADMVRESVFNMLGGRVEGIVLDLFAGSGAYGLEAISRGASFLYAVDSDKDAIKTMTENAKLLKETENCDMILKDYLRYMNTMDSSLSFDLVFIDPPYEMIVYHEILEKLANHMNPDGMIVCESSKNVELNYDILSLKKIKEKVYGIKRISIYQKY